MATNGYQTPGMIPAASGVAHHTPRERIEVDPDAKGDGKSVTKATEAPAAQAVRKADEGGETGAKGTGSDGKPDLGPKTDPANLVRAQEIASRNEQEKAAERKASIVASAAEMVGAPEELVRLDGNRDGRIDQLELQHALRAKGDDTTYAALSHYQKALGFGPDSGSDGEKSDAEAKKAEKLFAQEIADAERAKLLEKQQAGGDSSGATREANGDSPETASTPDPTVKIVV